VKIGATSANVAEDRANGGTKDRDQGGGLGQVNRAGDENTASVTGDVPPIKKSRLNVASGPGSTPGGFKRRARKHGKVGAKDMTMIPRSV
jgi:hypothetical protein